MRAFGGVLEHPAFSHAWAHFDLQVPDRRDSWSWNWNRPNEWTCEVWQSAYGHAARKRTWLLYVGSEPPMHMDWRREPGTHQIGNFDRKKPTLAGRAASATPSAFRNALLALARGSGLGKKP